MLLKLPVEIRVWIYEYVIEDGFIVCPAVQGCERRRVIKREIRQGRLQPFTLNGTGLLLCCRHVSREVIPLIYNRTHFEFNCTSMCWAHLSRFLKTIGPNLPFLRTITLKKADHPWRYLPPYGLEPSVIESFRRLGKDATRVRMIIHFGHLFPRNHDFSSVDMKVVDAIEGCKQKESGHIDMTWTGHCQWSLIDGREWEILRQEESNLPDDQRKFMLFELRRKHK